MNLVSTIRDSVSALSKSSQILFNSSVSEALGDTVKILADHENLEKVASWRRHFAGKTFGGLDKVDPIRRARKFDLQ